ncbi:unnamed protein product [Nippostrongylus brasiliensis]|uniref:Integrase catalytic domain-containing protein n=1 Tax=Nippostrongylus brasiliensis TaxID=27835 RepID=A0A0N4XWD6_NIPBR|nr:unnamed protein product [Nippostrongylus brasiliensis]
MCRFFERRAACGSLVQQHLGLDYFGPLAVQKEGTQGKCYWCIITCLVTRLIHLDVVEDASANALVQSLRRFFASRGVPATITSDNAPNFILADTTIAEAWCSAKDDQLLAKELCQRKIQWKYITPFAPSQGGVYERLIGSVKQALYKTLGRHIPTKEELLTLVIEVEAMLNTRPLVHVEAEDLQQQVLRRIDLLQKDFEVAPPLDAGNELEDDPDFCMPGEQVKSLTKRQLIAAIESAGRITDQFWHLWQTQYLTALREKHQSEVKTKRGARKQPKVGQLVLIVDAMQPRHTWKMGRIEDLKRGSEGSAREALVVLPSRKKIKRPLNLLVPLELESIACEEPENQVHPSGNTPATEEDEPEHVNEPAIPESPIQSAEAEST